MISGSEDKTVRLWDLSDFSKTKSEVQLNVASRRKKRKEMNDAIEQAVAPTSKSYCWRTLHGHESAIKSLDFFEDVIISGDIRGYIMVWHKGSGNCLNVLGLNPRVGQLVQIGIDEETDSQRFR